MKKQIIPSIIAKSQKELDERIKKVSKHTTILQLDVMDGKFVPHKSIWFGLKLPKMKCKIEAQLMVKDPESWIQKYAHIAEVIILSFEGCKDIDPVIDMIKKKRKKAGLGINPETSVAKIKKYLDKIDMITVMTVHPGRYGAKFVPKTLEKVKQLRKLKPDLDIEVDGSMNPETIKKAFKAGANKFVIGSYIQKSKNIKAAIAKLKESIKKR